MRHLGNRGNQAFLLFVFFFSLSLLKIMTSKALLSFFIIFSSFLHLGFSDSTLDQLLGGLGQISALQDAECMQKLLPCKTFLKSSNSPPPTCCLPLNEMVNNQTKCLCTFFNNPQLLRSFNVSKEDILKLPNSCGIKNVDASICDKAASSPPSNPSTGVANIVPAAQAPPIEDSTSSTKMINPYGIIHFGAPGFVALLTALVFSAY